MTKFEYKIRDKIPTLMMTLSKEETLELSKIYDDHKEEIYGVGLSYIFMDYRDIYMFITEMTHPKRKKGD